MKTNQSMHRTPVEIEFTFNGFRYAGQVWGRENQVPVLAIHGWLDNSSSFHFLAPKLTDTHIVAPDLAGHGFSDHRKGLSDYPIWSETAELFAIADSMGWDRFAVIGHSRGAMMALLLAATFPERITHLILLDALLQPPVQANQAPDRMVKSIREMHRRLQRAKSCYPTYEEAIQARCQSEFSKITQQSAEILASRGLVKMEQGYHWHADGKLWAASKVALTAEQLYAFIKKITSSSLLLIAKHGLKRKIIPNSNYESFINSIIDEMCLKTEEFDDGHHLHMEASVDDIAISITNFLGNGNLS